MHVCAFIFKKMHIVVCLAHKTYTGTEICIFVSLIVWIQAEVETLIIFCTNPWELQQKSKRVATN